MQQLRWKSLCLCFGPGLKLVGLISLISLFFLPAIFTNSIKAETNYSLRFYRHGVNDIDRVKIKIDNPAVPVDVSGDFTLEFWLKANLTDNPSTSASCGSFNWINGNIIFDRDIFGGGDSGDYGVSMHQGKIRFGVGQGGTDQTICGATNVANGQWRHIAVTRRNSDGQMRIYVDGQQDAQGTGPAGDISYRNGRSTSYPNSDPYLVIGAEKHDAGSQFPSYNGFVDEVHISNNIRYSSNFTRPSAPFTPDSNTVALYHFNEGPAGACATNTVVLDSSGAGGGPSNGICRYGGANTAGPVFSTDTPFSTAPPTPTPTPTLTPTPDTVAPIISNISVGALDTTAAILWNTNEPATSQIEYGLNLPGQFTIETSTYKTLHRVLIDNLLPGANYECWVYSKDAAGNQADRQSCDFSTLSPDQVIRIYLPLILK